jgi:hypothetical protein
MMNLKTVTNLTACLGNAGTDIDVLVGVHHIGAHVDLIMHMGTG